jgi:N-acetylneuraminic acid mutarotase
MKYSFYLKKVRNGCTLNSYQGYLILFGGIHDITWELDDLWAFETSKNKWRMIYEDTARRRDYDSQSLSPIKLNSGIK